ncbi:MAG TPA: ATP-binding cassette domain-containing protein, partial [Candidatus Saccharimonadales bacterium]|nr:ATP-binding cassette domain-containing protein [Candidatus Saccharimonadales bacterium]
MRRYNSVEPVAELRDVHFIGEGKQELLHGVSLSVMPRERLLIAGPNGSGKSTILRIMENIVQPSEGEVHLFGNNMNNLSQDARQQIIRERVGVGFQAAMLDEGRTVAENISSLHDTTREGRPNRRHAAELLVTLGLRGMLDRRANTLSGGEKQRVAMARLLLPAPELILMDEPTASLDSGGAYGK